MWVCTALQGFQINTGQSLAEFVAVDAHKATITAEMERFGMGVGEARGWGGDGGGIAPSRRFMSDIQALVSLESVGIHTVCERVGAG